MIGLMYRRKKNPPMRGLGISEPPAPPMRSGYDWVDVSEEKEPPYEGAIP